MADGSAVVSSAAIGVAPTRRHTNRLGTPIGERDLPPHLFGETPNRATGSRFGIGTLRFSDNIFLVKWSWSRGLSRLLGQRPLDNIDHAFHVERFGNVHLSADLTVRRS